MTKSIHYKENTNRLRWSHTFKLKPSDIEQPKGESMTVPDDSYSIKDLVKKFASGIDPAISKIPNYGGDEDEVDFDDVDLRKAADGDLTELDEHRANAKRQLQLLKEMKEKQKTGGAGDVPPPTTTKKDDEKKSKSSSKKTEPNAPTDDEAGEL